MVAVPGNPLWHRGYRPAHNRRRPVDACRLADPSRPSHRRHPHRRLAGTIIYANDAVSTLLGWTADDLVGRPVTDLVPQRLLAAHRAAFARWAEGETAEIDGRYLRLPALTPSGDEVPVGMVLSSAAGADVDDLVVAMIRPRDAPHEAVNAVALELMDVLSSEQGLAEAIDALLSAIGQRLDWDVADLWVIDDERGVTRVLGQWTADPVGLADFQEASRGVSLRPGEGLPGRVWASGVPVTIERIGDDPVLHRQEQAQAAGLHTAVAFPVEHDDAVVGVIELFRLRPQPVEAELVAVLADIGAPLGRHLHRVQTAERQLRADQRQRLITAGVERLVAWLDYPAPLDELCDLLVPEIADACVVDLIADTGLDRVGQAYVSADYSAAVAQLSELVPIETVEAGPMAVLRSGETVVYDDIGAETLAAGLPAEVPAELIERLSPTSTLIVPLIGRGRVVGTMTLTRQGGRYDDEDGASRKSWGATSAWPWPTPTSTSGSARSPSPCS